MEPTILYKKGGPHRGPKGVAFSYKGVKTQEELKSLLSKGWYNDLGSAIAEKKEATKRKATVKKEIEHVEASESSEDQNVLD